MIGPIGPTTFKCLIDERRGSEVEIGDASAEVFIPHVKLKRWGGECSVSMWFAEDGALQEAGANRVRWSNENVEVWMHPLLPREAHVVGPDGQEHVFTQCEEGGFEVNIILKKKPGKSMATRLRNMLPFMRSDEYFTLAMPMEVEGLVFYHQPALHPDHPTWCEEEGGVSICPENVVGSYAVYHAAKGNMHSSREEAEKYKAGKAFHIYRPRLTDATGASVWGNLTIDDVNGYYIVDIPWSFLDKAV